MADDPENFDGSGAQGNGTLKYEHEMALGVVPHVLGQKHDLRTRFLIFVARAIVWFKVKFWG
jgi:hypothetical protein